MVARRLNTEPGADAAMMGAMGVVRLPLTGDMSAARALNLRARMLDANTDVPLHAEASGIWLRLSAHAYNDVADYEKLAETVAEILRGQG